MQSVACTICGLATIGARSFMFVGVLLEAVVELDHHKNTSQPKVSGAGRDPKA